MARITRRKAQFFSIFGQIERAAAEYMLERGRATKIPADRIPDSELKNEHGQVAAFAIVVPGEHVHEFNEVCANLRA